MSTRLAHKFVLGTDPYPDWFKSLDRDGRVSYTLDESKNLSAVTITNTKDTQRAVVGDTILCTGDLCIVVPKAVSQKYMK